jgi:hypothetical protein
MKEVTTEIYSWNTAGLCVINRNFLGYGVQMVNSRFLGYGQAIQEENRIEFRSVATRRQEEYRAE